MGVTDSDLTDGEREAIPELRTAVMRLSRRLRQERDDQLTPSQLAVLGNVALHGPMTPGDLAAMEHVKPPTMSRIIAGLEAEGWAARLPHPTDGRQCLIDLTDKARHWIRTYREVRDVWLAQQMSALSHEERRVVLQAAPLLQRLAQP